MSYGFAYVPPELAAAAATAVEAKKETEEKPKPDPTCQECPHPALDHNGDGWGDDEFGPYDWFACPVEGCECRMKGYLHIKPAGALYGSTGAEEIEGMNPYAMYAGLF